MKHQINLVMGDWSNDGHGLTETIVINSNLSSEELNAAHVVGCEKVGVNFDNIAADYEENTILREDVEKLAKFGFDINKVIEDEDCIDDDCYYLTESGFAAIWLFVAKLGNASLEYEILENNSTDIHIGGYGLFS